MSQADPGHTYDVQWTAATGFSIGGGGGVAWDLLFGSGPHVATSIAPDLGFAAADILVTPGNPAVSGPCYQSRRYVSLDFGGACRSRSRRSRATT